MGELTENPLAIDLDSREDQDDSQDDRVPYKSAHNQRDQEGAEEQTFGVEPVPVRTQHT